MWVRLGTKPPQDLRPRGLPGHARTDSTGITTSGPDLQRWRSGGPRRQGQEDIDLGGNQTLGMSGDALSVQRQTEQTARFAEHRVVTAVPG